MENLPNIQIANGDTPDGSRPEPDDGAQETPELRALRDALEAMQKGKAPDALCLASALLEELATTTGADALGGAFANDGARHFGATLSAVRACRLALDLIEVTARQMAREDADWHRGNLADWQAVGVSPVGATVSE
jgi:hypothetical protein